MDPLPIDSVIPDILAALKGAQAVVVEAPPGAGKTTRVPRAILEAGIAGDGDVVVLQPRRLPTRLAARRVADEMGARLGDAVGYTVRFEDATGPKTRLRYVTEGILTRRLLHDPALAGTSVVVLDEFHERHVATDLGLALLRRLQLASRPDLKLVVMSATLDAAPIARWLGGAPRITSEGRRFDVRIDHMTRADRRPLHELAAAACRDVVREADGDVLVFLPGAAEIARTEESLAPFAREHDLLVLPLHGTMTLDAQQRAVAPATRRKVILATNVAETSVTIEGVTAVVDSGLARVAGHSPWSGLPTLALDKTSRASAAQRAGRAGRTRAGRAQRLYTKDDFDLRPAHDTPEIRRADLAETVLSLAAFGVSDPGSFEWFEPPPLPAVQAAVALLQRLGALDADGRLNETGRRVSRYPVHPRLARIIVEGERRGVAREACALAAIASERDITLETRTGSGGRRGGSSDLLDKLELLDPPPGGRSGVFDRRSVETVKRARRQLERLVDSRLATCDSRLHGDESRERALLISTLTGFPDRVARRRRPGGREIVLSSGGAAELGPQSVVHDAEFMAAIDAEDRKGGGTGRTVVRTASRVDPDWLLEMYPSDVVEGEELVWNGAAERVDEIRRLSYGSVALTESVAPAVPSEAVSKLLSKEAMARGIDAFDPDGNLPRLAARAALVRTHFPDLGIPDLDPEDAQTILEAACRGLRSFAELRAVRIAGRIAAGLKPEHLRAMREHAPERLALPGGREVPVRYETGKPPWVESFLQDFFGMKRTPTVCAGRVPVVVHLLAPSRRPVQVTSDLAGFWKNHYPAIRRELARRYPKHQWPEDGATAKPPQRKKK
ncbi:MAG: ATP-dependent helicase HrpB [Deltaproteobacteria bacterium]|nr:ATP-dependent helicase HrpB [Deltaproteobacteria bacterium]